MDIQIKLATHEDLGDVTLCVCAAMLKYITVMKKQPKPMLADYNSLIEKQKIIIATKSDKIAGVLVFDTSDEGITIETIAVNPYTQGNGVGRKLISFAETVAVKSGFPYLNILAHRSMDNVKQIYEHLGFRPYDERIVDGYDRIYFRKRLIENGTSQDIEDKIAC